MSKEFKSMFDKVLSEKEMRRGREEKEGRGKYNNGRRSWRKGDSG